MKFTVKETKQLEKTIAFCYAADPELQKFSRNSECDLDERVKREVECLKKANETFKFFEIYDGKSLVGYFGAETIPVPWLSTFFIMPEYRDRKDNVWEFISAHFPNVFYSGLFKVNTRAIKFFEKHGGKKLTDSTTEDKPSVVFIFTR
jgi:hypothetical protein